MRKDDESLIQKCFHNKQGICNIDDQRCELCQQFKSFDKDLRREINRKIKQQENKVEKNRPVDKYTLDIAFGSMPEEGSIQYKL